MSTELNTFEDIYSIAIDRVKGDAGDTSTVNFFKEVINTRYRTICSRKKWKFLRETRRSLKLPIKYTTGTISITKGSRVVTGALTSWTSTHNNWWLKPDTVETSYKVITVTSTTQIILSSPLTESTITAGAYKLYQSELALPPDCEDVDDIRIDGKPWMVKPIGPGEMSYLRQRYPSREGAPVKYTIDGTAMWTGTILSEFILGFDFLGQGNVKAISFFPHIPDDNYTIQIPYKRKVSALINDADEPLIPIEHRHILLYFALSDWYMKDRQDQTGKYYEGMAKDELRELETKFLDTDDVLTFQAEDYRNYSKSYLLRTSQYYFDREG